MLNAVLSYLWKIPLCAAAFYIGTIVGGLAASMLGLPVPELPPGANQLALGQYLVLVSLILAVTLALLARNLSGGFLSRWLSLALLVWIAYGVNNVLEGAIFTTMAAASLFTVVLYTVASLFCGAAAAWLFPTFASGDHSLPQLKAFFSRRRLSSWLWRLLSVFAAFPLIYLAAGSLIAPLVSGYYEEGLFQLSLPGWGQIIPVLLLRSLLFLLSCLPILVAWQSSRRSLFIILGFSLFILVGGLSMLQAYWLPAGLRIIHSLEILFDELVYAGILVALLAKPETIRS